MKVTLLKATDGYDDLVRDCIAANADYRCGVRLSDERYLVRNLFEVEKFQLNLEPRTINHEQLNDWGAMMWRDRDQRGTIWSETCRVIKELYNETGVGVQGNDIVILEYNDGAMATMLTTSVYFDGMVPMFMENFHREEYGSFVDTILDNPENCRIIVNVNEATNIADVRGIY